MTASFIAGDLLGWDVQHASIGVRHGMYGNLLEYIYRRRGAALGESSAGNEAADKFIEGWRYCTALDKQYDSDRGTRHTLPLILRVYSELLNGELPEFAVRISREDYMNYWARTFAFDTLISNTDRHAENWAVVVSGDSNPATARMAALYDNGTSLGCGIDNTSLQKYFGENDDLLALHLIQFRERGRHHIRLKEPGKRGAHFEVLCRAFLKEYPEGRRYFEIAASTDVETVREFLGHAMVRLEPPAPYALTPHRQQHMCAILQLGVQRIESILKETSS